MQSPDISSGNIIPSTSNIEFTQKPQKKETFDENTKDLKLDILDQKAKQNELSNQMESSSKKVQIRGGKRNSRPDNSQQLPMPVLSHNKSPLIKQDEEITRITEAKQDTDNQITVTKEIAVKEEEISGSPVKAQEGRSSARKARKNTNYNEDYVGDEIDELIENIDKENETKKIRKSIITVEKNLPLDENIGEVINIAELKEQKEPLTHSQLLLALIELCVNCKNYGFKQSNKARSFWKELCEESEYATLLSAFKAETLRKYWRFLDNCKDISLLVATIEKHAESIDKTSLKLLTIIQGLVNYVYGDLENLEGYLTNMDILKASINPKPAKPKLLNAKTATDADIDEIAEDLYLIEKQIKESPAKKAPVSQPSAVQSGIIIKNPDKTNNETKKQRLSETNVQTEIDKNMVNKISENDRILFGEIEKIVQLFKKTFANLNEEYIIDTLKQNSFNLKNTYLSLKDPEKYKNLRYLELEDYILKHMKGSAYYEELVKLKGEESLKERERFLNII